MATHALVSVEEYLHTSYSPDVDYVEGEIQERNMGEFDHAEIQSAIIFWLRSHAAEWQIRALAELRVQTAPKRYRIPDVVVIREGAPREQVLTHAPLIAIEILSPEDRFGRIADRIEEYLAMGVPNVWIIYPAKRIGYIAHGGHPKSWIAVDEFAVADSPIFLALNTLFAALD